MPEETTTTTQDNAADSTLLTGQAENTSPEGQNVQPPADDGKPKDQADDGVHAETATAEDADTSKAVPEGPDGYKFEFEQDTKVDEALLGGFREVAHQLGITHEQAQKLAGFYAEHVKQLNASALEASLKHAAETEKGWINDIKAMPDFEGRKAAAGRAMEQFATPELVGFLNETRLGSHPELFKFVANIGKALAEPNMVRSEGGSGNSNAADILYPNHGKGG